MRRWRLVGDPPDLARALDRLHVLTEVHAVLEESAQCEVYLAGELPVLEGVTARELPIPDGTWTGLEADRAIRVGQHILVRPPWVAAPADFAGVELVVPRAMAFGSGEHGSTRAALDLLERVWTDAITSLADIGTGSGILALYAAQRGCPRIVACDIDPAAVAAARALVPAARVICGTASALAERVDCVVVNMRASETLPELAAIEAAWNGAGPLVVSGLRAAEEATLTGALRRVPHERAAVAGYVALAFAGAPAAR